MTSGLCSSRARWPLAPNFCSRATRKSQIFHTNHMLGTLDFTGSEHWAPFNFPQSPALDLRYYFVMAQEYNGVLEVVLTVEFVDKILWCTPFKWNLFRKISISLAAASSCHIFHSTIMKDSRLLVEKLSIRKIQHLMWWNVPKCDNQYISWWSGH